MRESGRMLATVLEYLRVQVAAGVTTKELGRLANEKLEHLGGKPAFLGYHGFADVLCVSVNDAIVHGIPNDYVLKEGDIVGLDFGVIYNGMITDGAISMIVGKAQSKQVEKLLQATKQSLELGIDAVKNGAHVGDIGAVIEKRLRRDNLGIIEALVGHGVGYELHEKPEIPNVGIKGQGPILKEGMTIAIEPMATLGSKEVYMDSDGWTVKTQDGSVSAHFEHTVLVTNNGAEILTAL